MIVNAGPHVKAGLDRGGDARPHISVRIDGEAHHLILKRNLSKNCCQFFEVARLSPETEFLQPWAIQQRRVLACPATERRRQ
ncbi:hypothetical protein CHELA20_50944 [Hyphomicrobiales bacterium]|nr:hypothetical protein CHELA20_50944 [Hyphomicrobiales bacterium]CAH1675162.1 hypothetical protein CHELA41_24068 [Hyphomicrobiales bacterium]